MNESETVKGYGIKVYKSHKDFALKLSEGDVIEFDLEGIGVYVGEVQSDVTGWYVHIPETHFVAKDFVPEGSRLTLTEYVNAIQGYTLGEGFWPYSKTRKDLTKVVRTILKELSKRGKVSAPSTAPKETGVVPTTPPAPPYVELPFGAMLKEGDFYTAHPSAQMMEVVANLGKTVGIDADRSLTFYRKYTDPTPQSEAKFVWATMSFRPLTHGEVVKEGDFLSGSTGCLHKVSEPHIGKTVGLGAPTRVYWRVIEKQEGE